MAKTTRLQIRVAPSDKENAEALFERMGLNTSLAVNLFIKECLRRDGLPFNIVGCDDSNNSNLATDKGPKSSL